MNYAQISLTSRCNRRCWHCPMAQYLNTDDPVYHLDNAVLTKFIYRWMRPSDWLIELTGGEPMLYAGIDTLLDWLAMAKYKVHLRTNGIIPTKKRKGLTRIVAFHDLKRPPVPEATDVVLIVDKIESEEKVAYCEAHNLPYRVIGFNKENPDSASHDFKYITYIDPSAHNVECPAASIIEKIRLNKDINRMEFGKPLEKVHCCSHCKAAIDAWRFLNL